MFGTTTRTQDDANRISQGSRYPPQRSLLRVALRSIGKILFSSRETTRVHDRQQPPSLNTPHLPRQSTEPPHSSDEQAVLRKPSQSGEARYTPTRIQVQPTPSRERPKGPRQPSNPNGFGYLKRAFSKSRKQRTLNPEDTFELPRQEAQEQRNGTAQKQTELRIATEVPAHATADVSKPTHPEGTPHSVDPRPTTAGYVPRHAAKDFFRGTQQRPALPQARNRESTKSKSSPAYVPKHVATDFSKMNLTTKIDPSNPLLHQFTQSSIIDEPTIRPAHHEAMPDSTDYQNFLEASRKAAIRTANSRWDATTTPHVLRVMDDMTFNHHARRRESAMLISQRSTTSRPVSRGGSFIEKDGEYIEPTRPESVDGKGTTYHSNLNGDDRSSFRGRVFDGQEGQENSWSRVGGPIRRSFPKDRDRERDSWNGQGGKRRRRVMPVSPALKKYNDAVQRSRV